MPVPRRMVDVWAARKDNEAIWSTKWVPGATGDGGRWGSATTTCSPVQMDSQPASSAVWATRAMVSGSASTPLLTPKNPNFTRLSLQWVDRR